MNELDIFYAVDYIDVDDYEFNISIDIELPQHNQVYINVSIRNQIVLSYKWNDTVFVDFGDMTHKEYLYITNMISKCTELSVETIRDKIIYEY